MGTVERTSEWRLAESILDAVVQPIFVVDDQSRLYFANGAARRLLDDGGLLAARGGRLEAREHEHVPCMAGLLARLGNGACPGSRESAALPHPDGLALLIAVPLDLSLVLPDVRCAGLLIVQQPSERAPGSERLKAMFALSDAEARVAALIIEGSSVAAVSAALGITVATVRAHLKAVFRKTGVNRQQDLVRILLSARLHVEPPIAAPVERRD